MKYILYGAGHFGRLAADLLGTDHIEYFVASNPDITSVMDIPVKAYGEIKNDLSEISGDGHHQVVICVNPGSAAEREIAEQLSRDHIIFVKFSDIGQKLIRERIIARPDYIGSYRSAIEWIKNHSIDGEGIIVSTGNPVSYPEVTGYFIPTLLQWGYRDLAASYGRWLVQIQKEDGSWYDPEGKAPYVFDSGQILKGLVAIRKAIVQQNLPFLYSLDELDRHIISGCSWILSNMSEEERLTTPSEEDWGKNHDCDDMTHLYCLEPIIEAGKIYGKNDFIEKAKKILTFYTTNRKEEILQFGMLSHFWSYVIEALVDLGKCELAEEAMKVSGMLQDEVGFVPAYKNAHWICTTGLFQQAVIWYKLGNVERGNRSFESALSLQNKDGGWSGSYQNEKFPGEINTYFAYDENSWTVKYFLDALYWKNKAEFDILAPEYKISYSDDDGRYQTILNLVKSSSGHLKVLDVGCGKGGYLNGLLRDMPDCELYGVDISDKVMSYIKSDKIHKSEGTLCSIPFKSDHFDISYTCEALEHAIDIWSAIRELCRVTKHGGVVAVIDKNKEKLGRMEIGTWQQWFDEKELSEIMSEFCSEVKVIKDISYEKPSDGLFYAWIGKVK